MSADYLTPKARKLTGWGANPRNSHKTSPSAWRWASFTELNDPTRPYAPNAERRTPLLT